MKDVTNWNYICDKAIRIRNFFKMTQIEFAHWIIHANKFYYFQIFELKNEIKSMGLYDLYSSYQKSYNLGLRGEVFRKFILIK